MSEIKWIWLSDRCGVGNEDILTLISRIGNIDDIYKADFDVYISLGINERTAEKLCNKDLDDSYQIMSWCQKNNVGVLVFDNEKFPISLRSLKNPPVVLYYVGKLPNFNSELFISVVGTRKMSEYGMKSAYKIAYEIAASGAITVSGMALGIDGVAACASIAAGGRTVAVLGSGIDVIYPKEHTRLYELIAERGTVMTEYPPSTRPYGYNFPMRNRIISGLGSGTLVVDAPEGSGALITAKNAIIQGKDVYAVPGNIGEENTSGTNGLIRDGATAVMCGRDVVKNYAFLYRHTLDMHALAKAESRSDFDPSELLKAKISMRVSAPVARSIPNEKLEKREKSMENGEYNSFESFKEKISKQKKAPRKSANKKIDEPEGASQSKNTNMGDNSQKIIESLSQRQRDIFDEMPMDKPVTVDYFTKSGYTMGEVMSALTILEIKGLVSSLPGALYIRK